MDRTTKVRRLLWEIFLGRWLVIINAPLLLYSIATTFRDAFPPEIQDKYQLHLFLPKWPWQSWVAVFAVANFLIVLRGAYLAVSRREDEKRILETKLQEIEGSKPRLIPKRPDPVYVKRVSWRATQVHPAFSTWVARVRIVNDPPAPHPLSAAKDVVAQIRITHRGELVEMDGRWADSDQPGILPHGLSRSHLLFTSFNIGAAHDLDLIIKYCEDGPCFALNNDNSDFPGLAMPNRELAGDIFQVQVRLRGPMVDESFEFEVHSVPSGLEVTQPIMRL